MRPAAHNTRVRVTDVGTGLDLHAEVIERGTREDIASAAVRKLYGPRASIVYSPTRPTCAIVVATRTGREVVVEKARIAFERRVDGEWRAS